MITGRFAYFQAHSGRITESLGEYLPLRTAKLRQLEDIILLKNSSFKLISCQTES